MMSERNRKHRRSERYELRRIIGTDPSPWLVSSASRGMAFWNSRLHNTCIWYQYQVLRQSSISLV